MSERTPTEKLPPTEIYSKKNEKCKKTKLMINITDNKETKKKATSMYVWNRTKRKYLHK